MAGSLDVLSSALLDSSLATDLFGLGLNKSLLNKLKLNEASTDNETPSQMSAVEKMQEFYGIGHLIHDRYLVLDYRDVATPDGKIFFCIDLWDRTPCVIKRVPVKFDISIVRAKISKVPAQKRIAINRLLHIYYGANSEAKYFATLPFHDNVVRLLRVELTGTSILLVQEWLPNTLSDLLIDPNLKFSPREIINIVFSICRGLEHCIKFLATPITEYFHGDIKPENIFISRDGIFKLADFGGNYTEDYASPEIIAFYSKMLKAFGSSTSASSLIDELSKIYEEGYGAVDFRTDVFSIGKILEELCKKCNNPIFANKAMEFAERCLMPLPNQRPQSIQEIYDTLNRILEVNDPVDSGHTIESNESNDGFQEQQKIDGINTISEADNTSQHLAQQLTTKQLLNLVLIAEISKENQEGQENVFRKYSDMLNNLLRELRQESQLSSQSSQLTDEEECEDKNENDQNGNTLNQDEERAKTLYYAGEILMHINRPDEALRMYSLALKRGINHAMIMAGMARAFFRLSDWDNAIKYSQAAVDLMLENYSENQDINPLNYNSIGIYVNSIFNKIMRDSSKDERLDSANFNMDSVDLSQVDSSVSQISQSFTISEDADANAFEWILSILQLLHIQQPTRKEPLKFMGYIYYILRDYDKAITYYKDYLADAKDDYATVFYYAIALYCTNDLTNAKEQFRFVSDLLDKLLLRPETTELPFLLRNLQCKYFLGDIEGFYKTLELFANQVDKSTDANKTYKANRTWLDVLNQDGNELELTQFAVINQLFEDDIQTKRYYAALFEIAHSLNVPNAGGCDKRDNRWCKKQICRIQTLRNEINDLGISKDSIAIKSFNVLSYHYESILYSQLGNYDAMLQACDNALEWDKSASECLFEKAEAFRAKADYIESIPLYRQAFNCQKDEKRRNQIKRREKETLICYLYEEPDEFYQRLLKRAYSWGINPSELKDLILNYGLMFGDSLLMWLSHYTEALIEDILNKVRPVSDVESLVRLLRILQHLTVPELSEEDKEPLKDYMFYDTERQIRFIDAMRNVQDVSASDASDTSVEQDSHIKGMNVEFYFSRFTNFTEVSLNILNMLIDAANKHNIPILLFNLLPMRGANYYARKYGNREENLKKSIEDFKSFLDMDNFRENKQIPYLVPVIHNLANSYAKLGSLYVSENFETNYLDLAIFYYDMALRMYSGLREFAQVAKVHLNTSICLFKQGKYQEAEMNAMDALEGGYISAERCGVLFSQAQYIFGSLAVVFISRYEKHNCHNDIYDGEIKKLMEDGIHSFLICIQLYRQRIEDINDTDDTNEKLFSLLGISYLYQKKEEHYHDGSWVLAKYYRRQLEELLMAVYKESKEIDTLRSPRLTYRASCDSDSEDREPTYQEYTKITAEIRDFLEQKLDEHFYELR